MGGRRTGPFWRDDLYANQKDYTDDELLQGLRKFHQEERRNPCHADLLERDVCNKYGLASHATYVRHFGGLMQGLRQAGLISNEEALQRSRQRIDHSNLAEVRKHLREMADQFFEDCGYLPTKEELFALPGIKVSSKVCAKFGGYRELLLRLGYPLHLKKKKA